MKPGSVIYAILKQVCLFKIKGRECVEKKNSKCFHTERTNTGFRAFVQVCCNHYHWLYFYVLSLQYKLQIQMSNFRWDIGKI